jgi:hypothetical protein
MLTIILYNESCDDPYKFKLLYLFFCMIQSKLVDLLIYHLIKSGAGTCTTHKMDFVLVSLTGVPHNMR